MQLSIDRSVLTPFTGRLVDITNQRSTLPILSHVHISASQDNYVYLTATDLEVGVRVKCPARVALPGQVAVPGKKFKEFVDTLPDGPVDITVDANFWCAITAGKTRIRLAGMDGADYPVWNAITDVVFAAAKTEALARAFDKVMFASSADESRFNLNSVCIEEIDGGVTRLTTTDGHRLAQIDATTWNLGLGPKTLLPVKSAKALHKMLTSTHEEDCEIGRTDKNLVARIGQTEITMRFTDGEFPDYNRVIPTGDGCAVHFAKAELESALKRVRVLTGDRNRGITATAEANGRVVFTVTNPDLGTASDEVLTEDEIATPFEIIVNVEYLLESLAQHESDVVTLIYHEDEKPIFVRTQGDTPYFSLVMPMYK